ncbi:MAG TPA: DUF1566 domain-containing protein [Leptospiraceae bacterium]|nr:DUF1566 domain-containing protein [Leptospiraceae bacterium]
MKLKQLLQFSIPNSALRIIIFTFLITNSAFLINGCFLTAKYNHPMDGIGGIILNAVLLNTTRNASLAQTVVFTGLPSVITEGQTASVDVKLALATTSAIQVTLTLDNPAITVDGLASKVLTFAPENATVNQTIKLAAFTDTNRISETVNLTVTATGLADQTVSISTIDNTPVITVSNPLTSVKEGSTATFGVKLSGTISSDTKVTITSSNTTSVSVAPASITFTSSNASTDQIVTLTGLQDSNSNSESFTITLSSAGLSDAVVNVTTTDDDCYAWGCFVDNENGTVSFTGSGTLAGTNLVWMKCSQGKTYDASSKTCIGVAGTYQFCSVAGTCTGGSGYLNGTGSSQVYTTCNNLNSGAGIFGRVTWRVPTDGELKSIVYCSLGPFTLSNGSACGIGSVSPTSIDFFSLEKNRYWTSFNTGAGNGGSVNFLDGSYYTMWGQTSSLYVQCVSTGP